MGPWNVFNGDSKIWYWVRRIIVELILKTRFTVELILKFTFWGKFTFKICFWVKFGLILRVFRWNIFIVRNLVSRRYQVNSLLWHFSLTHKKMIWRDIFNKLRVSCPPVYKHCTTRDFGNYKNKNTVKISLTPDRKRAKIKFYILLHFCIIYNFEWRVKILLSTFMSTFFK